MGFEPGQKYRAFHGRVVYNLHLQQIKKSFDLFYFVYFSRPASSQAKFGGTKGPKSAKQQQLKSNAQETQHKKQVTRTNAAAGKTSTTSNAAPIRKRTVAAKFTSK